MGLNILLPFEQEANPVIAGDHKLVHMKYFFTRKLMFVKECDAVVCLPGGFGTLDEALGSADVAADRQTRHGPRRLAGRSGRQLLARPRPVRPEQLLAGEHDLAGRPEPVPHHRRLADSGRRDHAVLSRLSQHAVRRDQLVLRLQHELPAALLSEINQNFADILVEGQFTQSGALPEERDEPDLKDLPRLVLRFNRRSSGPIATADRPHQLPKP